VVGELISWAQVLTEEIATTSEGNNDDEELQQNLFSSDSDGEWNPF
jgi:hypothetical protein